MAPLLLFFLLFVRAFELFITIEMLRFSTNITKYLVSCLTIRALTTARLIHEFPWECPHNYGLNLACTPAPDLTNRSDLERQLRTDLA